MSHLKTYSREEFSRILAKASEIQSAKDLTENQEGLNESELHHVAEEVGISKESLNEALLNYDTVETSEKFNWLSGTAKIQKINLVSGEMNDEKWDTVVQEIRKITGGIGKTTKVGKAYEWEQRRKEIGYRHISIKPENGKTRIQYVYNWWGVRIFSMIVPFFALMALTAIALDGSNFGDIPSLLIAITGGLVGIPFGRMYLKSYYRKQKRLVKSLFSSIAKVVKDTDEPEIAIEDEQMYNRDSAGSPSDKIKT